MILKKDLSITWYGHSTFKIVSPKGKHILIDPWVTGNPACPQHLKKVDRVDLILIAHGHFDHMADAVTIARAHSPKVVGIYEVAAWLEGQGDGHTRPMNMGGSKEAAGYTARRVQEDCVRRVVGRVCVEVVERLYLLPFRGYRRLWRYAPHGRVLQASALFSSHRRTLHYVSEGGGLRLQAPETQVGDPDALRDLPGPDGDSRRAQGIDQRDSGTQGDRDAAGRHDQVNGTARGKAFASLAKQHQHPRPLAPGLSRRPCSAAYGPGPSVFTIRATKAGTDRAAGSHAVPGGGPPPLPPMSLGACRRCCRGGTPAERNPDSACLGRNPLLALRDIGHWTSDTKP